MYNLCKDILNILVFGLSSLPLRYVVGIPAAIRSSVSEYYLDIYLITHSNLQTTLQYVDKKYSKQLMNRWENSPMTFPRRTILFDRREVKLSLKMCLLITSHIKLLVPYTYRMPKAVSLYKFIF